MNLSSHTTDHSQNPLGAALCQPTGTSYWASVLCSGCGLVHRDHSTAQVFKGPPGKHTFCGLSAVSSHTYQLGKNWAYFSWRSPSYSLYIFKIVSTLCLVQFGLFERHFVSSNSLLETKAWNSKSQSLAQHTKVISSHNLFCSWKTALRAQLHALSQLPFLPE